MSSKGLSLIAAACKNNGIGNKGNLPWRLKNEMAFFTKTTSATSDPSKRNAVIMGRKTWDSIPPKYRPLGDRINVVLSENLTKKPDGADYLFNDLPSAIKELNQVTGIEKLFVIGGARVYADALDAKECQKIYLTRIDSEFECDAFFPDFDMEKFKETTEDGVPVDVQEEKGIRYKFLVYERAGAC